VRDSTHRVPVVQTRKEKRALAGSPMFYHRRDTTRSPPPEPHPSPKRTLRSTDKTQPAVAESSEQPAQKRARFADRVSETTAVVNTTPTAGTQSLPAQQAIGTPTPAQAASRPQLQHFLVRNRIPVPSERVIAAAIGRAARSGPGRAAKLAQATANSQIPLYLRTDSRNGVVPQTRELLGTRGIQLPRHNFAVADCPGGGVDSRCPACAYVATNNFPSRDRGAERSTRNRPFERFQIGKFPSNGRSTF